MPAASTSLITRVKSKLFVRSWLRSIHALDGSHPSLQLGRSHDFEDLRPYQHGDLVRDIEWRATARQGEPMVKRSRVPRKHTVLFVVDTGRRMSALARDERPKHELAVLAIGVIGLLSLRHGDDVALVSGCAGLVRRLPPGGDEGSLERLLRSVDRDLADPHGASALDAVLADVTRTVTRRMVVVVVTDESPVTDEMARLVRRLRAQHDLLWVTVADAEPVKDAAVRGPRADVDSGWMLPSFVHGDAELVAQLRALDAADQERREALLASQHVSHARLTGHDHAILEILRMLHRRSRVRV
ncbi:DUF58 domain-containing protein [Microbacterium sp. No. 7]|uniref:DUF58 domain-containing protein n=1 Tax=Microbacterium sp. No. 7 TaxID=1714373 RepID=UPI0006D11FD9|nr:DUF58 domain-containing protein [Microbacterium sp. No. 7]ALJ21534.1 hypothetical protein AOA12_17210 [Microbacterium sp. No. 7]